MKNSQTLLRSFRKKPEIISETVVSSVPMSKYETPVRKKYTVYCNTEENMKQKSAIVDKKEDYSMDIEESLVKTRAETVSDISIKTPPVFETKKHCLSSPYNKFEYRATPEKVEKDTVAVEQVYHSHGERYSATLKRM